MSLHTAFNTPEKEITDQPVIQLKGVSVRYHVPQERIPSFKEYAIRWIKGQINFQDFWALRDIDLEIGRGEVFGIIGPNGAGKSTLLKVVSRVLRPTAGNLRVRGRISPLLELGAGFDPELTGRENVYLNGAILGYSKQEIAERFDQIVEFAGLNEFINAPVRTYSTGMYARLGFSVATFKRPEILIVDEILGVGDAEFQTKSFERIQQFQGEGTTILLVSHSLDRVKEMCTRAVWLDHGKIVSLGSADNVVELYLQRTNQLESERLRSAPEETSEAPRRWGSQRIEICQVKITGEEGREQNIFQTGESLTLHMDYHAHEMVNFPNFGIAIHRQDGTLVTGPNTALASLELPSLVGKGKITYTIPNLPLLEGLYQFSVAIVNQGDTETFDFHDRLYPFRVINHNSAIRERYGLVTLNGEWQHQPSG
jgi:lipopolysaccharide transport system ATP-binding protein